MIDNTGKWDFRNREEYKKAKQMDREQMRKYIQQQFDTGYLQGVQAARRGIEMGEQKIINMVTTTLVETLEEVKGIGDKRKEAILSAYSKRIVKKAEDMAHESN